MPPEGTEPATPPSTSPPVPPAATVTVPASTVTVSSSPTGTGPGGAPSRSQTFNDVAQHVIRAVALIMLISGLIWGFMKDKISGDAFVGLVSSAITYYFARPGQGGGGSTTVTTAADGTTSPSTSGTNGSRSRTT